MSVGRCHSAFVHYEMFHGHGACHGGGNNYGSIFNINYNCNGRHGGFWSGLGAGLGYGIGGWLMGGLNMLGGLFGFGGMGFGGGLQMPWLNWGGGSTGRYDDYSSRRHDATSRSTEKVVEKPQDDSEYADINKVQDEVTKLLEKDSITQEEYNTIKGKIDKLTHSNGNNDANNEDQIETLKGMLPSLEKKIKQAADEDADADSDSDGIIGGTLGSEDPGEVKDGTDPAGPINYDGITGLTNDDKKTLNELGVRVIKIQGKNGEINALSLPKAMSLDNLNKLKAIADKHNIPVAVANNKTATLDKWIAGKIDDIKLENNKLSYTVNCDNYGELEYKYTVTQKDANSNDYKIDLHSDSNDEAKRDGYSNRAQDYEFKEELLRRNGSTVMSKWY